MNKIKLFGIIIISLIVIFPSVIKATSGACSSHGGVNCSAGMGNLGANAICNDGFESSTSYYDTKECTGNFSTCSEPIKGSCSDNSDIVRHCGTPSQYTYEMYDICRNDCQNQINQYQSQLQTYNNCISNTNQNYTSNTTTIDKDTYVNQKMQEYCVGKYGNSVKYNSTKIVCECIDGYFMNSNMQCMLKEQVYQERCVERDGLNSKYDPTTNNCKCNDGYVIGNTEDSKCETLDQFCTDHYGLNVHVEDNKCTCNSGYTLNISNSICEIQKTPIKQTKSDNKKTAKEKDTVDSPKLNDILVKTPTTTITNYPYESVFNTPTTTTPVSINVSPQKHKNVFRKMFDFIKNIFN